jgi:predicted chitinase
MKASQFVPGYVSQAVKVESKFTDYELAIMEGGLSLDKPKSALHQAVSIVEAFDKPYEILRWEKGDFGDVDAIARLDDNTFLSIMFNKGVSKDSKEEAWSVEFYRNNSQEVTGEGDAQRVFATVLSAIQTFIEKYKPNRITFSASKEVEQGQNAQSRARLYDSLVQRYARTWGFRAFRADTGNKVIYELNRIQPVAENFADGKVKGKSRPGRVKRSGASCDGSVSDLRSKAKNASGERAKMYHWCANMKSGRADESEILDDLEEGWKDWVAGAALGAAALSPQAADAKVSPQQKPAITQQVQGDAAYATKLILKPEAKILIQTARAAGMRGKELAQFVAQCAHETANFSSLKELGGRLDFKKYDPKFNPRKAKMLGNKQVGDGAKYHGRGYIQLTGRDNYKRAGQALGLPLEEQPELVERPDIAAQVAVWFWKNQVVPKVSNFNDTAQVTKPINSGLKGLDDRHNKFASIMALMGSKS